MKDEFKNRSLLFQRARRDLQWKNSRTVLTLIGFQAEWTQALIDNISVFNKDSHFKARYSYLVFGVKDLPSGTLLAMWAPLMHTTEELHSDYVLVKCTMMN